MSRYTEPLKWKSLIPRLLGLGSKVDVFLTGAPKSGSTSLHRMLTSSEVFNFSKKEIHYLSDDIWYQKWYGELLFQCFFPLIQNKKSRLNLTTGFEMYHPHFIERIHKYNAEARVIVLLRNPTTRFISDYRMIRDFGQIGQENGIISSLTEKFMADKKAIQEGDHKGSNILRTGIYHPHVKALLEGFNSSNLMFITQENLLEEGPQTIQCIADFLKINLSVPEQLFVNTGIKKYTKIDDSELNAVREKLDTFYRPHNEKLSQLVPHINY